MKLKVLLSVCNNFLIVFMTCNNKKCPVSIIAASYNLRNANHNDSVNGNGWGLRYPVIAGIVQYHELRHFWNTRVFHSSIGRHEKALPEYDYIGVGRDNGKTEGEHSAIFYRTDKFEVIDKGDFWMSETPDVPSKGWDCRVAAYLQLGAFQMQGLRI